MKTKSEILKECSIQFERLQQERPLLTHNIHKAMDEYAHQIAMEFAEWCVVNKWEKLHGKSEWHNEYFNGCYTTSELFAKFEAERSGK